MHRVHHFASSAQAYDASLDAGSVREGDILVIDAERIVGLASTDPIAITTESGALKAFAPMDRESLLAELVHDAAAIGRAVDEALRHRLPVADHFLGFAGPSHVVLPSLGTLVVFGLVRPTRWLRSKVTKGNNEWLLRKPILRSSVIVVMALWNTADRHLLQATVGHKWEKSYAIIGASNFFGDSKCSMR